jgi:hypothetical protein
MVSPSTFTMRVCNSHATDPVEKKGGNSRKTRGKGQIRKPAGDEICGVCTEKCGVRRYQAEGYKRRDLPKLPDCGNQVPEVIFQTPR